MASAILALCAPALLASAWWVWAHDRGPISVRTPRSRRDHSTYEHLALRVHDLHTGRLTLPGRWVTRLSLVEAPALANVLRGDTTLLRRASPVGLVSVTDASADRLADASVGPQRPHVVHVTEVLGGVQTYLQLMLDHQLGAVHRRLRLRRGERLRRRAPGPRP